jgi:hypothetical protein
MSPQTTRVLEFNERTLKTWRSLALRLGEDAAFLKTDEDLVGALISKLAVLAQYMRSGGFEHD